MVQKCVQITEEHDAWLKENCISLTRVIRKYISLEMKAQNASRNMEEENIPVSKASSKLLVPPTEVRAD